MERNEKISLLWIVVMFNMVFADILGFIVPGALKGLVDGTLPGFEITQLHLLIFAILLEIPIVMIFLSRVLKGKVNKWTNIIAALITILFIIGGGSPELHYIFFASVETLCMLFIIKLAWNNKNKL